MNVVYLLENEIVYCLFIVNEALNVFFLTKNKYLSLFYSSAVHLLIILNPARVTETWM